MAKKRFLNSTKAKGLKFEVLKVNKEVDPPIATLRGDTGVPFEIRLTQETLEKYGYEVLIVEEPVVADATVFA